MSENFDNNMNNNVSENTGNTPPIPEEPKAPFNPPQNQAESSQQTYSYAQPQNPNAYANNPQYATSNQYMPYGSYMPKPEAEKKPSKGKKKGLIAVIVTICAIFLVSVAVLIGSFIYHAFTTDVPDGGDDTQMNLADTPNKTDTAKEDGAPLNSEEVYKKVYESSVGILVYSSRQQKVVSEGTGIVMGESSDGKSTYIITCAHVIDVTSPTVIVQTHDGTQYDGVVVGLDKKTDIGLLRINKTGLKAAEFANSDNLSVGNKVYAIGNPGGTQFFGSFTDGMISAIGRPVNSPVGYEVSCIQHTAAINPGNSGGALVNEYGQVIGINSSKIASTDYEGMGFSVPSATVKEIVDELIKNGRVTNRPVLGIKFMPASYSQSHSIIVKTNNLPAGSIIIDSIMNSDLLNKDVKAGDMIIGVNGEDLESYETLMKVIENGKVGDEITLTICRIDSNYQITTFDITTVLIEDTGVIAEEEAPTQTFPFPFD